jgi:hypothetical protein
MKFKKRGQGIAQVVEHLPSMYKKKKKKSTRLVTTKYLAFLDFSEFVRIFQPFITGIAQAATTWNFNEKDLYLYLLVVIGNLVHKTLNYIKALCI